MAPRDPATRREIVFGALFHADVWGPYPIEGFYGTKYFLFFADDAKRWISDDATHRRTATGGQVHSPVPVPVKQGQIWS